MSATPNPTFENLDKVCTTCCAVMLDPAPKLAATSVGEVLIDALSRQAGCHVAALNSCVRAARNLLWAFFCRHARLQCSHTPYCPANCTSVTPLSLVQCGDRCTGTGWSRQGGCPYTCFAFHFDQSATWSRVPQVLSRWVAFVPHSGALSACIVLDLGPLFDPKLHTCGLSSCKEA